MDPHYSVSHQQASQLLHNKFVVVLGDSIQRSVYKDLVLLLQKEQYLCVKQLRSKGEMSFEQDCLIEGGCLGLMHNGTQYKEVRQFQSNHHLVRFYFVTRIYSQYMQSIFNDFRHGLKPDVVIINSCVWDISRYKTNWSDDYTENLHRFFEELNGILPKETLVIWNLTMPLGNRITGGFLVPEIKHKASQLRYDVIEANFYSGTLADAYGMDVLDLHFQFRFSLQHRTNDGIHWNPIAHRSLTCLLLKHIAQAWGIEVPCPLTQTAGFCPPQLPSPADLHDSKEGHNHSYRERYSKDSLNFNYMGTEESDNLRKRQQQKYWHERPEAYRPHHTREPRRPVHRHQHEHNMVANGLSYTPSYHFEPYDAPSEHHHFVMRSLHHRHHYAPYTHHRPSHHSHHGHYY